MENPGIPEWITMSEIDISLEETETRGRYEARVPGHDETGELTFSRLGPEKVIADHTGVPDSLRGTGVGLALVERLVRDAREKGFRIVPLCPFVRAMSEKHPEWADLFTS